MKRRKDGSAARRTVLSAPSPIGGPALRTGMPAADSVHSQAALPSTKPGGASYTIIRTTEVDSYDAPPAAPVSPGIVAAAPPGDKYEGTARKAAKLSIAKAAAEKFNDLRSLLNSLPPDADMSGHTPKIGVGAKSDRVAEEKRNVHVRAFLYAASREDDNDFHLIMGRDPSKTPEMYMTMELSGLPASSAKSHKKLKAARDSFKAFFGAKLPNQTYDFYRPPIPVEIEGSLFFDMSHSKGQRPGPPSLKSRMPTIWEVHPLSQIIFEP
jgi:hypothetical protein